MGRQKNSIFSKPLYFLKWFYLKNISIVVENLARKPTLLSRSWVFMQPKLKWNAYFSLLSNPFLLKSTRSSVKSFGPDSTFTEVQVHLLQTYYWLTALRVQNCGFIYVHCCFSKAHFPSPALPSQIGLPLVAVETCTSPSASIQNGSIPFSPDFPFQSCFLLLIHASPVPQAPACACNILLCIRQRRFGYSSSQQVLFPIIMCLEHR